MSIWCFYRELGEMQQMHIEIPCSLCRCEENLILKGLKAWLEINYEQVGQAEPSLDEMERGVLAEEEDGEGSGPVPLDPLISLLLPNPKIELNTAVRLEIGGNDWGGKKKGVCREVCQLI